MTKESFGEMVESLGQGMFSMKVLYSVREGTHWSRSMLLLVLLAYFCVQPALRAQDTNGDGSEMLPTNSISGTPHEQMAALEAQITNAVGRVIQIVNQPVRAYVRTANLSVANYSPGWFHPGAMKPNFDTVDIRKTQELPYAKFAYVTSDLNPGVVFMGRDLEFNAMTKYFYVDRSVPKHRLSEAEMVEINQLYRIIGHCQAQLRRIQTQIDVEAERSNNIEGDTEVAAAAPSQPLDNIRKIPQQKRLLYGGIAIGALILVVVAVRVMKRPSD